MTDVGACLLVESWEEYGTMRRTQPELRIFLAFRVLLVLTNFYVCLLIAWDYQA